MFSEDIIMLFDYDTGGKKLKNSNETSTDCVFPFIALLMLSALLLTLFSHRAEGAAGRSLILC